MEKKLLALFAHPDDEAFGTGGTLAKYAAEGDDVYLVTATRGEAGEIKEPDLATPANLPAVREHELRCACETYGIHPPRHAGRCRTWYSERALPLPCGAFGYAQRAVTGLRRDPARGYCGSRGSRAGLFCQRHRLERHQL